MYLVLKPIKTFGPSRDSPTEIRTHQKLETGLYPMNRVQNQIIKNSVNTVLLFVDCWIPKHVSRYRLFWGICELFSDSTHEIKLYGGYSNRYDFGMVITLNLTSKSNRFTSWTSLLLDVSVSVILLRLKFWNMTPLGVKLQNYSFGFMLHIKRRGFYWIWKNNFLTCDMSYLIYHITP